MSNQTKRGGNASLETGTPKVWQTLWVPENYTKMDIDDGSDLKLASVVQASPAIAEADEAVAWMTTDISPSIHVYCITWYKIIKI